MRLRPTRRPLPIHLLLPIFFLAALSLLLTLPTPAAARQRANTLACQPAAPSVAAVGTGGFVAVWQSPGEDGDGTGVVARVLDASGLPTGAEIAVNTTTAGDQGGPVLARRGTAVAADGSGNFVGVWSSEGQGAGGEGVYGQRFDSGGRKVGTEFQANTFTAGRQALPVVAASRDGSFVVVWESDGQDGDGGGIYGQRFTAAGARQGGELQLSEVAAGSQTAPAVAKNASGDFVVVWQTVDAAGGSRVFGRRFSAGGVAESDDFALGTGAGYQAFPRVALSDAGRFFVVFEESDPVDGPAHAEGRLFDGAGVPFGGVFPLAQNQVDETFAPDVTVDAVGSFFAVWEHALQHGSEIASRRLSGSGVTVGGELLLGATAGAPPVPGTPVAASDGAGHVAVVWKDGGDVAVQSFAPVAACVADATTLCLDGGRYGVRAAWTTNDGATGSGQALPLTSDTGLFWFFDANNLEMAVKVLDACGLNARSWVFAGGLTNVDVVLTVTDGATGQVNTYHNPQGTPFAPLQDTGAFANCTATAPAPAAATPALAQRTDTPRAVSLRANRAVALLANRIAGLLSPRSTAASIVPNPCPPDPTHLCLGDGRFLVTVDWQTPDGTVGHGQAVPLTRDTGYFWFFNDTNLEMVLKVLNGCGLNQRYWVFAGGLTNVRVAITVTDTSNGTHVTYQNPQGTAFQPLQDTGAFATGPSGSVRRASSGSHRTGKSTLLADLAERLPDHTPVDEPYLLMEEDGYPFSHPPALEDFAAQLARSIEEIAAAGSDALFDRCPVDFLAYLAVHEDAADFDLDAWLPRVRDAVATLDLTVFVPIEERDRIGFAEADDDGAMRAAVDEKLRELLLDDPLELGLGVVEVAGDPERRARTVLRRLRRDSR
ncbi:MAG TPA: AAA family ATPase [Thermoanaerobaculia bacterium]